MKTCTVGSGGLTNFARNPVYWWKWSAATFPVYHDRQLISEFQKHSRNYLQQCKVQEQCTRCEGCTSYANCRHWETECHSYAFSRDKTWERKQEAQQILTNPRDAFRGQSRSPNSTVPYVRYSFVLRNSKFVFKRHAVFLTFNFRKCLTLKSGSEVTRGHWKRYHRLRMVSYYYYYEIVHEVVVVVVVEYLYSASRSASNALIVPQRCEEMCL